jgi:DNA-directed RNA polymerase beta subunit
VRSSGPINQLTRQPVKGRKRGGGIRFGEMERDALIGHGTAFLIHDRLMNCSDRHVAEVCTRCKSILGPCHRPQTAGAAAAVFCRSCDGGSQGLGGAGSLSDERGGGGGGGSGGGGGGDGGGGGGGKRGDQAAAAEVLDDNGRKTQQQHGEKVTQIVMPYVVRYLVNQLAAMNVKVAVETAKYTDLHGGSGGK